MLSKLIATRNFKWQPTLIGQFSVVTNELVELEKYLVDVLDFMENIHHFREIYGIYLKLPKKNQKITTCNWLDLETLGF